MENGLILLFLNHADFRAKGWKKLLVVLASSIIFFVIRTKTCNICKKLVA